MKWTRHLLLDPLRQRDAEPTHRRSGPDVGAEVRRGAAPKEAVASVQEAARQLGLRGGDVGVWIIAGRRPSHDEAHSSPASADSAAARGSSSSKTRTK